MAKKNLTIFQKLNRALDGDNNDVRSYVIDKNVLKDLDPSSMAREKLEAQQTLYLTNQWKRIDNELYQKSVFYEPTRIAAYYDYEAMEFCLHGDTQIVTPDGSISIKELADKGKDNEFIVYAYDHNLKKVVPAKARNAHHTRDEMTYKITFDDDTHIIATYDHQFMKRDGSFERVKNLKPGDSMMPFYRKSFYNNENYNWVYTCNSDEGHDGWVAEHKLIAEWYYDIKLNDDEEVRHIDFNGQNNNPENLKIWDISEHRSDHCKLNNKKLCSNPEYSEKMLEVSKRTDNKHRWNGEQNGRNNPAYFKIPFDDIIETARQIKTLKGTAKALNISYTKLQREINLAGYKDWATFCDAYAIERSNYSTSRVTEEEYALNHKIVSIEEYGVVPVYDLTVPGYKNFATDTIFSHNTPEISAALDIFMEEATTPNEMGNVITITSDDDRIKNELKALFFDIMDLNTNMAPWIRNVCKYGDNFIYHKILPERGIIGITQLPNIEISRTEATFQKTVNISDQQNDSSTKFYWKNKDLSFNAFEVSHFRLLGDDRRLPYGTSILEKARRIWKQLLLAEDAMLVYRITRAPERRVYKVFVGNMDDKDVDPYVDKIANNFKRTNMVDGANGNVDLRYNQLAVDQDFFIPIRDVNQTNPIETLPGATNLSEIADIEYIQQKLFAALRIPKAFLGFNEAIGDGKNLAILDVRFARAVNRIQKAMIQELNKMAIIHLYLKGYTDDLNNFQLSMTSPSTQADILKIERWQQKILLYKDAVSDAGNGFGAMSMTLAKKEILDMSDDEIKLDIQRQAIERAAAEELKILAEVIKQTGVFRDLYDIYQIDPNNLDIGNQLGDGSGEDGDAGGAPLGGGSSGGSSLNLGGDTEGGDGGLDLSGKDTGDDGDNEENDEMEEINLSESAQRLKTSFTKSKENSPVEKRNRMLNENMINLVNQIDKITKKTEE